jgi:hypothetical protein
MELSLTDNKKFLVIDSCTELEYEQLKSSLTKKIEGWRFHPLVKKKIWDGNITFIKGNKIPAGLWKEVIDICKEYDLKFTLNKITDIFDSELNIDNFNSWVIDFFEKADIKPRDYQVDAAFKILRYRRCLAELATSAGKTLISFIVVAYMLEQLSKKKILMIVPNVSLVVQASGDFEQYNKSRVPIKIQQIYAGVKLRPSSNIVIGTYQSLVKYDEEYFSQFDAVFVDECLHPDTQIMLTDGSTKLISKIKEGDWVKTINDKTLEVEHNQVDYVHKNLSHGNQMFELEMADLSIIKITGNHKVKLITGIYKRVDELTTDDEILSFSDYQVINNC